MMLLAQLPFALGPAPNTFTTFEVRSGFWRALTWRRRWPRVCLIVPTLLVHRCDLGPVARRSPSPGNYGVGYPVQPFAGIAAMCVFCIVLGIFFTYVTVRIGSCLAAAVGRRHRAFVSAGIMFSVTGGNPFVGPMPVGIVGGSAFIVAPPRSC